MHAVMQSKIGSDPSNQTHLFDRSCGTVRACRARAQEGIYHCTMWMWEEKEETRKERKKQAGNDLRPKPTTHDPSIQLEIRI